MKKYYTTSQYKLLNKQNSSKSKKKDKLRKNKKQNHSIISTSPVSIPSNSRTKYKYLPAPENFSLINNTKEVMNFIHDAKVIIEKNKPLFIEMKNIKYVTLDAIIYTIVFFENIRKKRIKYKVNGDFPDNFDCKKLITESGFLKYIYPNAEINKKTDILTIRDGYKVDNKIAKNVVTYVRKWLNEERINTKSIYNILIECMANTLNHAFGEGKGNAHKWYLMAYHLENEVHFVFLDNGLGISKTLNKKWIFESLKKDETLILSALKGEEFRSQTGEKKRGKGLPKIYKHSKDINIKELIIIANKGMVQPKNGICTSLDKSFSGTLISWKIVKCDYEGKTCQKLQ